MNRTHYFASFVQEVLWCITNMFYWIIVSNIYAAFTTWFTIYTCFIAFDVSKVVPHDRTFEIHFLAFCSSLALAFAVPATTVVLVYQNRLCCPLHLDRTDWLLLLYVANVDAERRIEKCHYSILLGSFLTMLFITVYPRVSLFIS